MSDDTVKVPPPLKVMGIASASFGALLGAWIAFSDSPVVTTLLPLIFTAVGGAGAFKIFNYDGAQSSRDTLRLLATSVAALSLACLAATLAGVWARPAIIAHLQPKQERFDLLSLDPQSSLSKHLLYAAQLRAELEGADASVAEVKAILEKEPPPVVDAVLPKISHSKPGGPNGTSPKNPFGRPIINIVPPPILPSEF